MIYILLTSKDSGPNTRKYAWEEGVEWEWSNNRHVCYLFMSTYQLKVIPNKFQKELGAEDLKLFIIF